MQVGVESAVRDKHHKVGEEERKRGCSALHIRLGPFLRDDSGIRVFLFAMATHTVLSTFQARAFFPSFLLSSYPGRVLQCRGFNQSINLSIK